MNMIVPCCIVHYFAISYITSMCQSQLKYKTTSVSPSLQHDYNYNI